MKFTDSVAPIMNVHELLGQMKERYQQVSAALAEIPDPYRAAAIQELVEMAERWANEVHNLPPLNTAPARAASLPSATQAILELLAEHTEGLKVEQIQDYLKGRFNTAADKPERVITSTLSQLRANSRVLHDGGVYRLLPNKNETELATLKVRVIDYFRNHGNEPATTLTLAKATDAHPNAIRSLFSGNASIFGIVKGSDAKPNSVKLWQLREKWFDPQWPFGNREVKDG